MTPNPQELPQASVTLGLESTRVKNEAEEEPKNEGEENKSCLCKWRTKLVKFYFDNEFLVLVVLAILLARAYPPLGATYLAPEITATWIAVVFIFVLAGMGLKTEEFKKAFQRVYFNSVVQIYNFGVVSAIAFGFSRLMVTTGALTQSLADGMVICSCLPLTINMVLVLTKTSGGDEAAAIFNAAFGNLVGVFLSPVLILGYLGVTGDVDLLGVFTKLALRVVLPIAVGQILQKTSKTVVAFVKKYKEFFKQAQMYALVFIVYTVFCQTFEDGSDSGIVDIFLMIIFQLFLLTIVMLLAWFLLKFLFRDQPELRVMGLFGCTHKTVAMGVPLINAIYENNPNVGLYTLPLLIWHPMQLVIGTFLSPRLNKFVQSEKQRLGIRDDDHEEIAEVNVQESNHDDGQEDPADEERPASLTQEDNPENHE
jgi:sodium/bile acid cotransporter 7